MSYPAPKEYAAYFQDYIDICPTDNLMENLEISGEEFLNNLMGIGEEVAEYRYAEGKWTIKELVGHIIDAERVFNYRALCIARGDKTSLPGFDHDEYVANSLSNNRTIVDLMGEFTRLRPSTIDLYHNFKDFQLFQTGNANGNPITVNALGFITSGHLLHHLQVIQDKYLIQ